MQAAQGLGIAQRQVRQAGREGQGGEEAGDDQNRERQQQPRDEVGALGALA